MFYVFLTLVITPPPPPKLMLTRAADLGVPQETMQDHTKKDLNLKPYYPKFANELSVIDRNQQHYACHAQLVLSCSEILFTEECRWSCMTAAHFSGP
jgi:hypothetical protein